MSQTTTPLITPAQARHWFQQAAHCLDVIAKDADQYLTAIGDNLDGDAANEISAAFLSARTAADTAFGAAYRASPDQPTQPEPATQQTSVTAGQPRYSR